MSAAGRLDAAAPARLLAAVALVGALLALVLPSRAAAHAVVDAAAPEEGARVAQAPALVDVRFSEPVTLVRPADDLTVVDAAGRPVVSGTPRRLPQDARVVEARLRPGLPDGTYTVRFRVLSADSHVVVGAYAFGVGDAPVGPPVLSGAGRGPSEDGPWAVSARVLELVGIGGLFGLVAVRWLVLRPAWRGGRDLGEGVRADAAAWLRERFWLAFALLALGSLVAEAYLLLVKSAALLGTGVPSAIADPGGVIRTLEDNPFGAQLQLRAALLVVLFATALVQSAIESQAAERDPDAVPVGGRPVAVAVMAAVSLVLIGSVSAQGHASQARASRLSIAADAVHVAGAAVWLVGLAVAVMALRGLPRVAPEGGRLVATHILARFSQVAFVAVAVVVATGMLRTAGELDDPAQLWETAHGRSIVIKLALLAFVAALALRNRRIVAALGRVRSPGDAALTLARRGVTVEIAVAFAVVVVAALLVGQVPGRLA
ncbi:MAG: copper resistance CopC family protein [Actinomycetota bacterium]